MDRPLVIPVNLEGKTVFVPKRSREFSYKDLTINQNSIKIKYESNKNASRSNLDWGQRKLLMSEIEMFAIYWDPSLIPNPICVYAGAAPGTHIPLLTTMFPEFTFHLYDPSDFKISSIPGKIKIFQQEFTDKDVVKYAGRNDIFFISDIRSEGYEELQIEALKKRGFVNNTRTSKASFIKSLYKEKEPKARALIEEALKEGLNQHEEIVWKESLMQQQWVMAINPEHASLKFRLPYPKEGESEKVQYLKGIVYWQVWPKERSAETRLKPVRNSNGVYEISSWDIVEYEEFCYHHNLVVRRDLFYSNIFTGDDTPIDDSELLNDYDSVAEAFILKLYFQKFGINDNKELEQRVKQLSRAISLEINKYYSDTSASLAARRSTLLGKTNKDVFRSGKKKQMSPEDIKSNKPSSPIFAPSNPTPFVPQLGINQSFSLPPVQPSLPQQFYRQSSPSLQPSPSLPSLQPYRQPSPSQQYYQQR